MKNAACSCGQPNPLECSTRLVHQLKYCLLAESGSSGSSQTRHTEYAKFVLQIWHSRITSCVYWASRISWRAVHARLGPTPVQTVCTRPFSEDSQHGARFTPFLQDMHALLYVFPGNYRPKRCYPEVLVRAKPCRKSAFNYRNAKHLRLKN
jgi:hypothetical protein